MKAAMTTANREHAFRAELVKVNGRRVRVAANVYLERHGGCWVLAFCAPGKALNWPVPDELARQIVATELDRLERELHPDGVLLPLPTLHRLTAEVMGLQPLPAAQPA